jgi:hypothetical protein
MFVDGGGSSGSLGGTDVGRFSRWLCGSALLAACALGLSIAPFLAATPARPVFYVLGSGAALLSTVGGAVVLARGRRRGVARREAALAVAMGVVVLAGAIVTSMSPASPVDYRPGHHSYVDYRSQ